MMSGPSNPTAHVKEKSGARTTSGIIMRCSLETGRSAIGFVDSLRCNGFSDQLSKLSGVEATFNDANDAADAGWLLGAKAEAAEQRENKRTNFMMMVRRVERVFL